MSESGERGMRAVPLLCIIYPSIHFTTEEKSRQNLSHGIIVKDEV